MSSNPTSEMKSLEDFTEVRAWAIEKHVRVMPDAGRGRARTYFLRLSFFLRQDRNVKVEIF